MWRRVPWLVVVCSVLLMGLGLTGIARGDELFSRGIFFCFPRQLLWVGLSLPAMGLAMLVPYRSLRLVSYPAFAGSLLLLVVVLLMPSVNGARCWIPLGFLNFQPSELAKLIYVVALAHYLMYRDSIRRLTGLVVPFVLTLIPVALILREPDLGTALLFLPTLFAMLFAAGARPRHLGMIVILGMLASPGLWLAMNAEQKSRIVSLFQQRDGGEAPRGDAFQQHQAKRLLARGGIWGSELTGDSFEIVVCPHCVSHFGVPSDLGLAQSATCPRCQKIAPLPDHSELRLPESRTDFIFCLIGERWGFVGCGLTLMLYVLLVARGLMIAHATREPFGRLLAVGIVTLLASQTIINTGMTCGLMPVTGITLPLASYGGSSLLMTAVGIGLLLNVGMRPGYEVTAQPFRHLQSAVS
ncbi:MAG: FtsW/RodA/SpoVE family cell cycle protein [Planctomycetaceae bacterium]